MAKPRKAILQLTTVSFEMHHPENENIILHIQQISSKKNIYKRQKSAGDFIDKSMLLPC